MAGMTCRRYGGPSEVASGATGLTLGFPAVPGISARQLQRILESPAGALGPGAHPGHPAAPGTILAASAGRLFSRLYGSWCHGGSHPSPAASRRH